VSGKPSAAHAPFVVKWIETAVGLALSHEVCAIVTGPIAKAPLYEAGFQFPGHTEYLADLTGNAPYDGARGPVMMLAAPALRTVLTTVHQPLSQVAERLSANRIVHTALVAHEALQRDFGVAEPRIAMAALNPHAGEGGAMGREEIDIIAPAVTRLRAQGLNVTDPRPADTLFHAEAREAYDVVVCHYHDQALIPLKTIDFWGGVNITLGLPIVRTSPDHGVGFDIAGRGVARPDSLIAALKLAAEIAGRRAAR
jgi:4-hydroxythreonine-4-phosphate dehydrogenase